MAIRDDDFSPGEWRPLRCDQCGRETARYKRPVRTAVDLKLVYADWNPPQAVLCPGCFANLKGLHDNLAAFMELG